MITPLVVGNWKMHGSRAECSNLARAIVRDLHEKPASVEVAIAPPYTALESVKEVLKKSEVRLAAQNCHWQDSGAFTGEISPLMLKEIGCDWVILGHSERRRILNESDRMIAQKIAAALRNGLRVVFCLGETLRERRVGRTASVISRQLRVALKDVGKAAIQNIEIAYEPVWAIGTGRAATGEGANRVIGHIRRVVADVLGASVGQITRILYGGSVTGANISEFIEQEQIDGALVGGASLRADEFVAIVQATAKAKLT